MGDAMFVGGGSVTWEINNSDGDSGGGDKNKCKGKDKDPRGPGGTFRVLVNGELAALVPVNGTRIQVTWSAGGATTLVAEETDGSTNPTTRGARKT